MNELDETSSPIPSEIMEKTIPALRVETSPNRTPNASPANPPTRGMIGMDTPSLLWMTAFIAWIATKPPSP